MKIVGKAVTTAGSVIAPAAAESTWTAEDVEQALWSDSIQYTKKRKR